MTESVELFNHLELELNGKIIEENVNKRSEQDLRKIVSDVLSIPDSKYWDIIDEEDNLVLVHYIIYDDIDFSIYGKVRGTIIDVENKIVVASSYGYTPTAVSDYIVQNENGEIVFRDNNGNIHSVKITDAVIRYGLEGVLIRVFLWGGKLYKTSHRRLNISRSKWGNSLPFETIYETKGGPDRDQLFHPDESYSPYVHYFLASHPDLAYVTKDQVGGGFIYYLGHTKMWSLDPLDCPFNINKEKGDVELWDSDNRLNIGWVSPEPQKPKNLRHTVPSLEEEDELLKSNKNLPIIEPRIMTIGEANTLLRYGYQQYQDPSSDLSINPRLRTGEFVVLYKPDGSLLRISSTAYNYRAIIGGDEPNRLYRFFQLTDGAKFNKVNRRKYLRNLEIFRKTYPPMLPYTIDSVKDMISKSPIYIWDQRQVNDSHLEEIQTEEQRIYNIWAVLLTISPPNRQNEVATFLDKYYNGIEQLVLWITDKVKQFKGDDYPEEYPDSIVSFLNRVKTTINKKNRIRRFHPSNPKYNHLLNKIIKYCINLESGQILYRLIKFMDREKNSAATK